MIGILSQTEFKKLEHSLNTLSRKEAAIMAILMYCGLRAGELILLRFKDLVREASHLVEVHVPARITRSSFPRPVPIPPKARPFLQAYLINNPTLPHPSKPASRLFPGSAGREHMSVHGIEQMVNRICSRLLSRHVTPHYLRHTYATHILKFSNIREVQMLLGHKKLSSTEIYTHPSIQDLAKSVNKAFP